MGWTHSKPLGSLGFFEVEQELHCRKCTSLRWVLRNRWVLAPVSLVSPTPTQDRWSASGLQVRKLQLWEVK